jgi:hypothetical protein
VRERLNAVYSQLPEDSALDPIIERLQAASLAHEDSWAH